MIEAATEQDKNEGIGGWFLREFHPARLLSTFTASLVVGLLTIILSVSFAALIFSGELTPFVSSGIGIMLTTAVVAGIIISLTSSYPGTISVPQDKVAPILALLAASIVAGMPEGSSPEETFFTICVAIAISSLITGLFLGAMGVFKLGAFIRFIPYPVIGGFLAGAGWLLLLGSIKTVTGERPGLSNIAVFSQPEMVYRWLPGLIFALLLLLVLRRIKHFLAMPSMLVGAIAVFYAFLWISGTSIEEARGHGWLLGSLPGGGLFESINLKSFPAANWSVVFHQAGSMATILLVSIISLLLNASAIELEAEHEMDLDHELRTAGGANIAISALGGMVAFHSLSVSALIMKMGVRSRMVGFFGALICGAALFFGASSLSFVPVPIIGGMLMFLGLSFLIEWVYETWFKLPRSDYAVIITILVVISGMGYLQGVAVGIVSAIVLFVVNYSRINVIKYVFSGTNFRSNVDRPKDHRQLLREKGEKMLILKLHGFIFFGTANSMLNQVRDRAGATDLPPLVYVVADFRHVTGIDTSAVLSLLKLNQLSKKKDFILVYTHLSDEVHTQLEKGGLISEDDSGNLVFSDLDYGVEWCENQILMAEDIVLEGENHTLQEQLEGFLPETSDISRIIRYMDRSEVPADFTLIKQGDSPDDLYFIESGQVSVLLELKTGSTIRLSKMGFGTVIGEVGMYLNIPRSASVVTDKPSVLYRLTSDALKKMAEDDPKAAAAFHLFIARLLAERLHNTNKTLRAILD